MRSVLVLGAGEYHRKVMEALRRDSWRILAVDRDGCAPAADMVDAFYQVDVSDCEKVLDLARRLKPDCVMPLNEFGMRAHAHACHVLGLVGNCPRTAEILVDKEQMRTAWERAGLCQPAFQAFSTFEEAIRAAAAIGYPLVVKPADSGGSGRGILVVSSREELDEAFAFAKPFARNGRILVENYIEGTEITVEGLVVNGHHEILAVSDKFKPTVRTRVATSLNYPADFDAGVLNKIKNLVEAAVRAAGATHSATHTELIVTPVGTPYLVEMGGRGGGGHIFSTIVEAVAGVNMPGLLARILAGDKPDIRPRSNLGACYRFFNPPKGILRSVQGLSKAAAMDGVLDIGLHKKPGDLVGDLANSLQRVGFVVTSGQNRREAWELANAVEETVRFEVEEE